MNSRQRSTKAERIAAKSVLKGIWEKAFQEGKFTITYSAQEKENTEKCRILHQALCDYRKEVRKNQSKDFDLFLIINACSISKKGELCIEITRKPGAFSNRTSTILELITEYPELGLSPNLESGTLATSNMLGSINHEFEK